MRNATTPCSDHDIISNSVDIFDMVRLFVPDPNPLPTAPRSDTDASLNQSVIFASLDPTIPVKRKAKYKMIQSSLKSSQL